MVDQSTGTTVPQTTPKELCTGVEKQKKELYEAKESRNTTKTSKEKKLERQLFPSTRVALYFVF